MSLVPCLSEVGEAVAWCFRKRPWGAAVPQYTFLCPQAWEMDWLGDRDRHVVVVFFWALHAGQHTTSLLQCPLLLKTHSSSCFPGPKLLQQRAEPHMAIQSGGRLLTAGQGPLATQHASASLRIIASPSTLPHSKPFTPCISGCGR